MVYVPYLASPDIMRRSLLQEGTDLLYLAPACARIVEQVAKFARVWLDIHNIFLELRIALEY